MACKDSTQIEIQVPLERAWAAFTDPNLLPNLIVKEFPGLIESIEILEGHHGSASAGSIWKLNFSPGVPHARYLKERIETDPETHTVVIVHLEGGSLGIHHSSSKTTFEFSSGDGDTTVIDWELEYEAIVDDPPASGAKERAIRTLKAIEEYLNSNNEPYT